MRFIENANCAAAVAGARHLHTYNLSANESLLGIQNGRHLQ